METSTAAAAAARSSLSRHRPEHTHAQHLFRDSFFILRARVERERERAETDPINLPLITRALCVCREGKETRTHTPQTRVSGRRRRSGEYCRQKMGGKEEDGVDVVSLRDKVPGTEEEEIEGTNDNFDLLICVREPTERDPLPLNCPKTFPSLLFHRSLRYVADRSGGGGPVRWPKLQSRTRVWDHIQKPLKNLNSVAPPRLVGCNLALFKIISSLIFNYQVSFLFAFSRLVPTFSIPRPSSK